MQPLPRGKSDGGRQLDCLQSLDLIVIQIHVRSLKGKNLECFGQKPIWSRTEAFNNRDLIVLPNHF